MTTNVKAESLHKRKITTPGSDALATKTLNSNSCLIADREHVISQLKTNPTLQQLISVVRHKANIKQSLPYKNKTSSVKCLCNYLCVASPQCTKSYIDLFAVEYAVSESVHVVASNTFTPKRTQSWFQSYRFVAVIDKCIYRADQAAARDNRGGDWCFRCIFIAEMIRMSCPSLAFTLDTIQNIPSSLLNNVTDYH